MDTRPIGVFDSGLGGLTVFKQLTALMPNEDIVYFGDTGRVPYGSRSRETILKYSLQDIAFLRSQGVKMVVAACGTASSALTDEACRDFDFPFTRIIEHASRAACNLTKNGKIGVIGTAATINSGAYEKAVLTQRPQASVYPLACPLFVPLAEYGYAAPGNPVTELAAQQYLAFFQEKEIDTLILGCTHYPLLLWFIQKILGPGVNLIDPGVYTAQYVKAYLEREGLRNSDSHTAQCHFFVSDHIQDFAATASRFLGSEIDSQVALVDLDSLG